MCAHACAPSTSPKAPREQKLCLNSFPIKGVGENYIPSPFFSAQRTQKLSVKWRAADTSGASAVGGKQLGLHPQFLPIIKGDLRFVRVLSISEDSDSGTTQTCVKEFLRCLRSGPKRKEARKDSILEPGLEPNNRQLNGGTAEGCPTL